MLGIMDIRNDIQVEEQHLLFNQRKLEPSMNEPRLIKIAPSFSFVYSFSFN